VEQQRSLGVLLIEIVTEVCLVGPLQREPGHVFEVRLHARLVAICAHEHNLKRFASGLEVGVNLGQHGRKCFARAAPVGRKIQPDDVGGGEFADWYWLAAVLEESCGAGEDICCVKRHNCCWFGHSLAETRAPT
jgi:hypothetical protein